MARAANRNCQESVVPGPSTELLANADDIRCLHDSRISKLNANQGGQEENSTANYIILINEYLKLPLLFWANDPLDTWCIKMNDGVLIPVIPVVKQFVCIPATSVPSEQEFSKAGDLVRKKKKCVVS